LPRSKYQWEFFEMGWGGARPGAGRKKGGTNQRTRERLAVTEAAQREGITPRDFFLRLMRDETQPLEVRMQAGRDCIRYVHPALTAVRTFKSPWELSEDEWQQFMSELERGPPSGQWAPRVIAGGKP
jgi:hypothetical protein